MVVIKWCTECKRGELGWGLWDNLISEEGPIKLFLMPWMISSCYNLGITLKCGVWDKIFYDRQAPSADKNQYICFAHTRSRLTSDTSEACTRVIWVRVFYIPAPCHAFGDITYHSCLWYDVWWKFAIMIMKFKRVYATRAWSMCFCYLFACQVMRIFPTHLWYEWQRNVRQEWSSPMKYSIMVWLHHTATCDHHMCVGKRHNQLWLSQIHLSELSSIDLIMRTDTH